MPELSSPRTAAPATAKHVIASVATRLQVDQDLLGYLFNECLAEVLQEAQTQGTCTLRGLGKFRHSTLAQVLADGRALEGYLTLFEQTRHPVKNRPFAILKLKKRLGGGRADGVAVPASS